MDGNDSLHSAARRGFTAGAEAYARGRPDYPAEIDGWLRDVIGLGPGRRAVDLGAGTGKFTSHLLATGAEVVAIEPLEAMRARLKAALPQVEARAGRAEAMPLPDDSVDAVICATAFHWFATPEAMAEIRRVLKPDGRLGLVWNQRDERVGWVARLGGLVARHEGDAPRAYRGDWKKIFPAEGFGPLEQLDFAHGHDGSPEDVILARVLSTSFIAALPDDERGAFAQEIRAFIAAEPELAGRRSVTVPYLTQTYRAVRL